MQEILFSALIANYNNAKYIKDCIESIINQTYKNIEIIIVDDASKDDSLEIIKELMKQYHQIKLFQNQENKGAGYTKKKCIDNANGEICGFIDPDDAIVPEAVEIMVKAHKVNPNAAIVYSTNFECDEHMSIVKKASWVTHQPKHVSIIEECHVGHFATFKINNYKRSIGMESSFKRAVDRDLYYALESTGELLFIDETLYYYRKNPNSISLNENVFRAEFWDWIVKFRHAQYRNIDIETIYSNRMYKRLNELSLKNRIKKILRLKK